MICSNCNTEIELNSEFLYSSEYTCPNCGNKIKSSSSVNSEINNIQEIEQKSLWEYFVGCYKKFVDFKGQARRKEFWSFTLFYFIFSTIATFLDVIIFNKQFEDYGPIFNIFSIVSLLPNLSVCIRRYHDCNKTGWVILIPIYNIILDFIDGTPGENRFGADPKGRQSIV